jgi:sensor histidine kinase YesM
MATLAPPEAAPGAAHGARGAFAAAASRTRRRTPRALVFMVALCAAIGALLWAFAGGSIGVKLVYSFAIGFACFGVMEVARLLQALLVDGWRRARGRALDAAGFDSGWRGVLPAMLATVVAGPLIGLAVGDALTGYRSAGLLQLDAAQTRMTLALTLLGSLAALFALSTMERLASARAQAAAAEREAAEHQLRLLQSQLEPHMLFNTLANLRVLIALDPPRAQAMLDRLIAFLRSTLAASRAGTHTLADEFARIDDYLGLMAVRMGARLQCTLELPPALAPQPVPALLLQPLVENAIRHGLEPTVEGGRIEVRAARDGNTLRLSVRDSGAGWPSQAASPAAADGAPRDGFGLTQVRERLRTRYAGAAQFAIGPAPGGGTLATLMLPLEAR